jgi:hypothetical protein
MATRKSPTPSPSTSPARTIVQHQPETKVRVILEIPQSLFDLYAEQGMPASRMPEDEMLARLHRCREHTALKPLYMNDEQRSRLERSLDHNFSTVDEAIMRITQALAIQVGDVGVSLPANLMRRLALRVGRGETWEGVVQRETVRGLEQFVGLR